MKTINMIGQPCPIPVVEAKKALSQSGVQGVIALVDNFIAIQNLEKMANGLGYNFSWEQKGETEYSAAILIEGPNGEHAAVPQQKLTQHTGGVTFLITANQIGKGDEEASKKLMKNFLYSLAQLSSVPDTLLLVNSAVKLAAQGSDMLDDLKTLATGGATIIACGQCLAYYDLTDKLAVGTIGNMLEIAETVSLASRTVTL